MTVDESIDPHTPIEGDRRNVGERNLDRKFELIEAIILAIATVFTAWSAFQATKWSGVQANSYSVAAAERATGTRAANVATAQVTIDVSSFQAWLGAISDENERGQSSLDAEGNYTPNAELLSGFLHDRFSDEMQPAFEEWIASDPFIDPDAAPTPFDLPSYELSSLQVLQELDAKAEASAATARDANQRGDNYVLVTVLLASVLFFAGISSKMDTLRARMLLTSLAIIVLLAGVVLVAFMPVEI
jgi:hypothetical protein